jgi:hypothetical protein
MNQPLQMRIRGLLVKEVVGEPTRFFVESSRGGKFYLTDIAEDFPQGNCSCPNHSCVRVAEFKRTGRVDPCKHLVASHLFSSLRTIARNLVIESELRR